MVAAISNCSKICFGLDFPTAGIFTSEPGDVYCSDSVEPGNNIKVWKVWQKSSVIQASTRAGKFRKYFENSSNALSQNLRQPEYVGDFH